MTFQVFWDLKQKRQLFVRRWPVAMQIQQHFSGESLSFCLDFGSERSWLLTSTRWWFQIFVIFTSIWGNDPFWLIFFKGSKGLKPPSRLNGTQRNDFLLKQFAFWDLTSWTLFFFERPHQKTHWNTGIWLFFWDRVASAKKDSGCTMKMYILFENYRFIACYLMLYL